MSAKPFEVVITRGTQVESRHQVHAVLYSQTTGIKEVYGDSHLPVFPRSALKPIQALPLILSGAAEHFQVSSKELALACASHRGEPMHTEPVRLWLARIGCTEADLECGTHPPCHQETLFRLLKNHGSPSPIHNNCSGKHTGMLCTSVHLGESYKNYVSLAHPVQQRILKVVEEFCEFQLSSNCLGVDGCSIPAPVLPLLNLAKGFANWSSPTNFPSNTSDACVKIFEAFVQNPLLTSGTDHYCAQVMSETHGRVLVKGGAEGVIVAAIPELRLGIGLKTLDGHSRASDYCLSILLQRLGLLQSSSSLLSPKIYNWNKFETGDIQLR